MVQTGGRRSLPNRSWEEYVSMHQACRTLGKSKLNGKGAGNVKEIQYNQKIATDGAGGSIRCRNLCGLNAGEGAGEYSLVLIGKTETALKVKSSAADATLQHAIIIAHYLDNEGVAHTATIADATADMSAATDFDTPVTDFYCWDIDGYGTSCFTCSITPDVGKTLGAGSAGTGSAQIINTATTGTKLAYLGVGTVYGHEAADTHHAGLVGTIYCKTPWGEAIGPFTWTSPVNSNTATLFLDASGFPIQSYYRIDTFRMAEISVDQCYISNAAKSLIYCGIENAEFEATTSEYMAFGSDYGQSFLGDIIVTYPLAAEMVTMTLIYHEKGQLLPTTISWDCQGVVNPIHNICVELEPLSEVVLTINDDAATGANANVQMRLIEIAA